MPNWKAEVETGEGIYYVDDTDEKDPQIKLLTLGAGSDKVIPISKSKNLDLSDYRFDQAVGTEWGEYIVFACRHKSYTYNNILLMYNREIKCWDKHEFFVSCLGVEDGVLLAGDSLSNNVTELFSGFADNESLINNHWESHLTDHDIERLKKTKYLRLGGEIGLNQAYDVYINRDNSGYVKVGTISGSGSYVDRGQKISVGSATIGSKTVGGGSRDVYAYRYQKDIKISTDKYKKIKLKFVATNIGYVSVSLYGFKDIRLRRMRQPKKYR